MGRTGRLTLLAGWVLGLVALLAGLLAVGDGALAGPPLREPGAWSAWLAERPPADAAMAVLRLVGVALTAYLLLATGVAVALRLGQAGRAVALADLVTLPLVRGVVQAGLGVGLAGAAVAAVGAGGGAVRAPTAAEVALVSSAGAPDPSPGGADAPVLEPVVAPADAAPPILQRIDAPIVPPERAGASWTVGAGDHLWSIAERVLTGAWSRPPTDAEIVPYWTSVIEANRADLADPANPDLLFPGQVLDVPAPPPPP